MNAKKAKKLRTMLAIQGINATEVKYLKVNEHFVKSYSINSDGVKVVVAQVEANTTVLDPHCGRSIYQKMKKVIV